ncbi:MAG: hypothetical protein DWC02_06665 [Candidatus Poseidoniales archaeon]|nr:MAG: hypothetical protein DWC02_06665 [Candidatus Poseidoniales archaeon]
MRISANYFGAVRCPKCKFQFDKISKSDSESIGDEKADKINTCIHCGAENDVNSTVSENYDYFRCRSCDFDSPISPKVGNTIQKNPWFSAVPGSGIWAESIVGCFLFLFAGIIVGLFGASMQNETFFVMGVIIILWGIFQFFVVLFINPAAELVEQTIVSGLKKIKK